MNRHRPPPPTPITIQHVWSGLPSDLQQRAIRLLAQLAYSWFQQSPLSTQEIHNGYSTQQPQDPSRSS